MMTLVILFVLGMVTSFVSTHTGGGALIAIPAMISLGLDPKSAVAAARLAGLSSMLAGIRQFHKSGKIDYAMAFKAALFTSTGCVVGALSLFEMPSGWVERIIALLIIVLVILHFLPIHKEAPVTPSRRRKWIGNALFFLAGMIGGFAGGQAIILTYTFMLVFGKTMTESIGTRKIAGIAIGVVALLIYGFGGLVDLRPSIAAASGSFIGSHFGTAYGLRKGDKFLARVFSVVAVLLALKLLYSQFI